MFKSIFQLKEALLFFDCIHCIIIIIVLDLIFSVHFVRYNLHQTKTFTRYVSTFYFNTYVFYFDVYASGVASMHILWHF